MAGGGTEFSLYQVLERAREMSELMVSSYSKAGGYRMIEKINDDRLDTPPNQQENGSNGSQ